MDFSNVLITYGTWRGRFITPRPRAVHVAHELVDFLVGSQHRAAIETIRIALEAGTDLTAYLSSDGERFVAAERSLR